MFAIYIILILVPLLGGCSWWGQQQPSITEEQVEIIVPEENLEEEQLVEDHGAIESEVLEEEPVAPSIADTAKQPKSIADLAQRESLDESVLSRYTSYYDAGTPKNAPPISSAKTSIENVRNVTIHNDIDDAMLSVKHWTGTYKPTLLTIRLNGVDLGDIHDIKNISKNSYAVPITDNLITAEYSYEFMNGMRKGNGSALFTVDPQANDLRMKFSWKTAWHVEFDRATPNED